MTTASSVPSVLNSEHDCQGLHARSSRALTRRARTTNGAHGSSREGTVTSVYDSATAVVELFVVATHVLPGAAREFIRMGAGISPVCGCENSWQRVVFLPFDGICLATLPIGGIMRPVDRAVDVGRRGLTVVVGALVLIGALSSAAIAAPEVASGAMLYKTYCAACHGTDARGNGPVAAAMRTRPPDLTQLARGNNGLFPTDRVRRIVDGREIESHGTRDMPVWGDVFRRMGSEAAGDGSARIAAIVGFLESIQQRNAH